MNSLAKNLPDETIYILDGTSMFFQAYYSNLSKLKVNSSITVLPLKLSNTINKYLVNKINDHELVNELVDNRDIHLPAGGLITMIQQFIRFVKEYKPRYIIAAFDFNNKTFRHDLYPEYKANRPQKSDEIISLLYTAPIILDALGVNCVRMDGYEADDIMATVSKWARSTGLNVVHVSSDKDMLQLIDTGVHVLRTKSNELVTINDVIDEYGIHPKNFCDFQALAGDSADNIPGVKGIGPKIASKLINHFQDIESLYAQVGLYDETNNDLKTLHEFETCLVGVKTKPLNVYKKLSTCQLSQVQLYKQLVTLKSDIPIERLIPNIKSDTNYINSLISQLDNEVHGTTALQTLINRIFNENNSNYDIDRSLDSKISSLQFRYIGERPYCIDLFSYLGTDFNELLDNFRLLYYKLDRKL